MGVGREYRKATGKAAERTSHLDETGSRANLRNGGREGPGGDEGKGNATSAKPHSRGVEQGHICERGTSRNADQKEHG